MNFERTRDERYGISIRQPSQPPPSVPQVSSSRAMQAHQPLPSGAGSITPDDACRARYDHLIFASERCANSNKSTVKRSSTRSTSEGIAGSGDTDTGVIASAAQRRRLLELGALTLLEAELESLSVASTGGDEQRGGKQSTTAMWGYASCLKAMVDRHYDNLCTLTFLRYVVEGRSCARAVCAGGKGRRQR